MDQRELERIENQYRAWSIGDIVRATTVDASEYDPAALELLTKELDRRGISQAQREATRSDVEGTIEQETRAISGIGGWLLLFLLALGGNSLAYIIIGISGLGNQVEFLFMVLALCALGVGVYGLFSLVWMIRKKNTGPRHARRWIWATLVVNVLYGVLSYIFFRKVGSFPPFILISSLVWLEYLGRSKRVHATYGRSDALPGRT